MSSRWKLVQNIVVGVGIVVSALIWFGHRAKLGTRVAITDKESVHYSGAAAEEHARALGAALQAVGYFNGDNAVDVLLFHGDEGRVVSFVVQDGKWEQPEILSAFDSIGEGIAAAVGGPPLTVRLIDDDLKTQREFPVTTALLKFSDVETVVYRGPATAADAQLLASALKTAGYLDGSAPATVLLEPNAAGWTVSFMVPEGKWDDDGVIASLRGVVQATAQALGNRSLQAQLVDSHRTVRKTLDP